MLASTEEAINVDSSMTNDRKNAEYYLLNYEKELKIYNDALDEYINYKSEKDDNIGGGKSNMTGAPTEKQALKRIEFERQSEAYRWLKAVEIVQRGLGERKNIFIRVRREAERNNLYTIGTGRKGWVVYAQRKYAEEIQKRFILPEIWISEATIKLWWKELINKTATVSDKIILLSFGVSKNI